MISLLHHKAWIDVSKGIGICLVVIGHCIFPCHQIIDIFHMPLFFFLAGLTFRHKPLCEFLVSKTNRIIIPYLFWLGISTLVALIPHPYGGPFNGPLWFLPTILFALIIMQIMTSLDHRLCFISNLAIIMYLLFSIEKAADPLSVWISRALTSYIYMYIGYIFKQYFNINQNRRSLVRISIISAILFLALFGYIAIFNGLNGTFYHLTIYAHNGFAVFICSLLGISTTLYLSKLIVHNRVLCWLGRNSLVIMCVHFPMCQLMNVFLSHLDIYQNIFIRIILMVAEWCVALGCASFICILCKKYIPRVTGYASAINVQNDRCLH